MLKKMGKDTRIKQEQDTPVPPGQYVTEKFPVLTYGSVPIIDLDKWRLKMFGQVKQEVVLDWPQFMSLQKVTVHAEFHCVTQWSNLHNIWEGVLVKKVMELAKPLPNAQFVMVHCIGGYTTNLALDVLTDDDALFAYRRDGTLLSRDHGGPLRLVVPKRYGWKSAKWVSGLEFLAEDCAGFWEERGYHMEADPWKEQRFCENLS